MCILDANKVLDLTTFQLHVSKYVFNFWPTSHCFANPLKCWLVVKLMMLISLTKICFSRTSIKGKNQIDLVHLLA